MELLITNCQVPRFIVCAGYYWSALPHTVGCGCGWVRCNTVQDRVRTALDLFEKTGVHSENNSSSDAMQQ
eukprot:1233555-Pyramimonas_sp.AAC.1